MVDHFNSHISYIVFVTPCEKEVIVPIKSDDTDSDILSRIMKIFVMTPDFKVQIRIKP